MSTITEDIDDLCLDKAYFEDIVFDELNTEKSNFLNDIDSTKIYLVRLWLKSSNNYVYRIGNTRNLYKGIKQIDNKYNCRGKIIIIACGEVHSSNLEKKIHCELDEYKIEKKLYNINNVLYDNFICLLKKYSYSDIFESDNYILENNNDEYLMSDIIVENNDNYILLDQRSTEFEYWKKIRTLYLV